jgi:hypothetical protein
MEPLAAAAAAAAGQSSSNRRLSEAEYAALAQCADTVEALVRRKGSLNFAFRHSMPQLLFKMVRRKQQAGMHCPDSALDIACQAKHCCKSIET